MSQTAKQDFLKTFKQYSLLLIALFYIIFCVILMSFANHNTDFFRSVWGVFFEFYESAFGGASDDFFMFVYGVAHFVIFSPVAALLIGLPSYIILRLMSRQPRNLILPPIIMSLLGMVLFVILNITID
ncbi:hypothetical protein [Shewanella decolorationis]|uniref:Uncharacterized protein n=1 Tax=Shewanella decolorationis S12 TaxID=1353536 RepID=A0ABN0PNW4_9GAMM|nr:hypothetical protein [Shewanella decolorationis]ESE41839.1 hypothetical protein SHD_1549 [Shewanella decolorationis S12]GLR34251.1 hypothetical protein GCM10007922_38100 [Shewanella decolorationis]